MNTTPASFSSSITGFDALIVGVVQTKAPDSKFDTPAEYAVAAPEGLLSSEVLDKVHAALKASKFAAKRGDVRTLFGFSSDLPSIVALVGLGKEETDVNRKRDQARSSVASALSTLRSLSPTSPLNVAIAPFCDAQGLAEGSVLFQFSYDDLKAAASKQPVSSLTLLSKGDANLESAWRRGLILADSQNLARKLAETPANLMTPTIFCNTVAPLFEKNSKCKVFVREPEWIAEKKMGSFASVGRGSAEPQRLLEIHYVGDPAGWEAKKVALVGKVCIFKA